MRTAFMRIGASNEAAYIAPTCPRPAPDGDQAQHWGGGISEAQQTEIENALSRLADEDSDLPPAGADYVREENDVFCGLFVKNLENVRVTSVNIIIMSVCYGHDASGRMLMTSARSTNVAEKSA